MNTQENFYGLGIAPGILEVLQRLNFKIPTSIQTKSIPIAVQGKDVMGIAQTGTGKTIAFGVPLIQEVLQGKGKGLVVLPTRELAIQVHDVFQKIGGSLGVKSAILIGGEFIGRQIRELQRNPDILIGTPGRIIDHLNQRTLHLGKVKMLVLDEADRMLDMGFEPQLARILQEIPKERQTMLFSATMPEQIMKIANRYMKLPIRIEIAPSGSALKEVTQELFIVNEDSKKKLLGKVLTDHRGSVLMFTRTKIRAKKITHMLREMGHHAAEIHSDRSMAQRTQAIEGFKSGRYRILVATDIASR
ncbi:MAG: DEAD/DEAH box helicase, partial [bacterium]|nr:DEAD/DEAH box helicase [bacterium]